MRWTRAGLMGLLLVVSLNSYGDDVIKPLPVIRDNDGNVSDASAVCKKLTNESWPRSGGGRPDEGAILCTISDDNGNKNTQHTGIVSYECPANSTAKGDSCTCDSGFSAAGQKCVAKAGSPTTRGDPGAVAKFKCPPIDHRLQPSGGLRSAAREIHDLADLYPSDIKTAKNLKSPRGRTNSTVALAEIELPDKCRVVFGSASGGNLSPRQNQAMGEMQVQVVSGKAHAEMNIRDNLPPKARVVRWGISWASNQRPDPCAECAPEVKRLGGIIETE